MYQMVRQNKYNIRVQIFTNLCEYLDLSVDDHNVKVGERVLSAQIFAIIEHYKQEDPVGLPGATIPDPLPVPDIKQSFTLATIHMKNVLAYGLSKFKIKNMEVDINELKVSGSFI